MALPEVLPLLPVRGRVLLPSCVLRVVVSAPRSLALVETLLRARATQPLDGVWVGVTSLAPADRCVTCAGWAKQCAELAVTCGASCSHVSADVEETLEVDGEQMYAVGCAARVLQISRSPARDKRRLYVLLLEGRTRFRAAEVNVGGPFLVARVSALGPSDQELDAPSADPELAELAAAFRDSALRLVSRLEGLEGKPRLVALLETAPPCRLADLFVATFASSFHARLRMLAAGCPKARLRLARTLVEEAALGAEAVSDGAELSKAQRTLRLQQQLAALRKDLPVGALSGAPAPPAGEAPAAEEDDELATLEKRLRASSPPADVLRSALSELRKLRRGNEQSPGHGAGRTWVEWIAAMPWDKVSPPEAAASSLAAARSRLDADHFGLEKVKSRVVEYLAVRRLRPTARPAILCLIGPPGVGKTSLAKSVAAALGRPFVRVALGGVRDEAEIRGHRRTYVAALPGCLVHALRRAGVRDPLILLDEVDKLGHDVRGDPASALLEVLDPEQNASYVDHYLAVPLDLSRVTFICTANSAQGIPPPLLDRLEVLRIAGYTHDEKLAIARRHIIPRLLRDHGLMGPGAVEEGQGVNIAGGAANGGETAPVSTLAVAEAEPGSWAHAHDPEFGALATVRYARSDAAAAAAVQSSRTSASEVPSASSSPPLLEIGDAVTALLIDGYTREAGVRSLERALSALCRATAVRVADGLVTAHAPLVADADLVSAVLGPPRFTSDDLRHRASVPGVVAGLVWTEAGGLVQHVEASALMPPPGSPGRLQLTGTLGDVIKESAQIAHSWTRQRANSLRLRVDPACGEESPPLRGAALLAGRDIHVHLPSGAVPKDGPSAGVTLACALCSLFSGVPARPDTAMTGELTLSGLVLPVGGIKEKLLAAQRAGLTRCLVPAKNMADVLSDVPAATRDALEVIPCATMDDVLREAFHGGLVAATAVPVAKL